MPDREKVIKEYEDYVNSFISLTTSHDYEYEMHKAVLALLKEQEEEIENLKQTAQSMMEGICLLKEQEAVEPYIDIDEAKCPICKVKLTRQELLGDDVLFEDFFDYCPHCGKPVLWEGR